MQQHLILIGMLAGGLGLFMLAVGMMTDGLKSAAGQALRDILARWTRTPAHGIFTGLAITAIVQSSSAVTVATIGFVNAGIISMRRALGVVYGSNLGTTMTGWLVAVVGFKLNIESFALPLIGLGMLLRLTGGESKRAPLGLALVGFGLFFIGVDVLKDAFDGLVLAIDFNKFTVEGWRGILMYVAIGFLITVLTQSSSAAIAITLTAASGGVLGLYAAAAMVIGANVGTTSTAAIAVIGATANAKRVASAHIIFNVGAGLLALLILPVLFWVVESSTNLLGLESIPAVTLALFHTVFNLVGVLLMLPFNNRLADFLEKRFITQEEVESRPQYLDKTVLVTPVLAVNALVLELNRLVAVIKRMGIQVMAEHPNNLQAVSHDERVVNQLSAAVSSFIAQIERAELSEEIAQELAKILRADQHLLAASEQALALAKNPQLSTDISDASVKIGMQQFNQLVYHFIDQADLSSPQFSLLSAHQQLQQIEQCYGDIKGVLLLAGVELRLKIDDVIALIEINSDKRHMCVQLIKALSLLSNVVVDVDSEGYTQPDVAEDSGQANTEQPLATVTNKSITEP
ncbi:Na/Pi cotransporter family protein [Dasania sp. GY-MA-18]|uniref:Na/Pi cotransporter family protein n=1 Tax=Dasania phycosphaerae TaxID=2950436 RepID=A0A9J6RMR1_9GAMM|nr:MULTISPECIES: Na/Pi cotransporter family protein [Dasania]MCR8923332.1 Na/Pi cotransporter family protein [Dasania sp. GY-MA-18]MCZ0865764.1 Na/Pi cotransporter family protein [Dasania phycosphaerae]MCZ0869489.1 Na/Pi cotransporter family protein [Dasania phycosphaerae]